MTTSSTREQLTSGLGEDDDGTQPDFGEIFDVATHDALRSKTREM